MSTPQEATIPLRKTMSRRTKAELVDILMELAEEDRRIFRRLTAQFDVPSAPAEIVAATRQAIIDATAFDKREMNRNFNYDYAAYDQVKRNLSRLVGAGQWRPAMELSLELMKRGSHQVEMSDEGLMTQDIEDCLGVVLESLGTCDLPAHDVFAWCTAMLKADRNRFIATEDLHALRGQFQAAAKQQHRQE